MLCHIYIDGYPNPQKFGKIAVERSGILIYRDIAALREQHMVNDDTIGMVAEG